MSEQFLATASVRIVPDVTGFAAALQAEVLAATAKVRIPAVAGQLAANTVATRTFTAATGVSTAAVTTSTASLELHGVAAAKDAAENIKDSLATAGNARAHEQLARGAGASILSLLGVRGATLAASSAFLAGTASIVLLTKAVQGAIDDQESLFRVTRILGTELGEGSKKWAESLANSFGLADDAALKFEGAIAETFHNVGLGPDQNARLSQSFVELAADLAAFAHVPVEQTLRGLQLSISGNTRALRQYGVVIQNTEVQQEALRETGKQSTDELTRQELTLARVALIQDRLSNVTGSFAANQGSLANQSKILSASIQDLGDSLGATLLPALVAVTGQVIKTVEGFKFLIDKAKDLAPETERGDHSATAFGQALHFAGIGAKFAALGTISYSVAAAELVRELVAGDKAQQEFNHGLTQISFAKLMGDIPLVTNLIRGLSDEFDRAAAKFRQGLFLQITVATNAVGAANTALLRVQAEGGSLQAQLAAAQNALDKAKTATAAADKASGITGGATKQKQALQAELQARQTVAGIQGQIDAENKKGATAEKKAGKTRQELLDEQDQALLDAQQLAQGAKGIAAEHAQHTKSLVDDIDNLQDQLRLTERQLVEAQHIHDAQTRLNTIQQLQLQAVTLQGQIDDAIAEQRARQRQRKLDALNSAVALASLDAQIAEVRGSKNAEINALLRENAALEKSRAAWKGNTQKQKEITLEIARNNAQIKELRKQTQAHNNESASLAFSFLQTQQGFAANLLGNLLSTSAVAGTVGGTSGAISTPTSRIGNPLPPPGTGFPSASSSLSAASQIAGGPAGASSGQLATLIHVQRQMLAVMLRLVGQRTHPEATHQRTWAATEMLNTGW